jgi:biofilm PGA synthesis N-glycosyltransferase PgaC
MPQPLAFELTAIIPAFNEAGCLADTIRSLQNQTLPVTEIIVVDDCSTDDTGTVARSLGVTVLRPPRNTGSKAGAQTYALPFVKTPFCMAIDADTELAPNAVEKIIEPFDDSTIAACSGFVLPRFVRTVWERGRYAEYLFAFAFLKPIQNLVEKPLISSGCFSAYRTEVLRKVGGWSNRTMAEDMDLTWTLYRSGYGVRFAPEAVCYPIEPHNFHFLSKQLRRWSHGFIQNVRLHWRHVIHLPHLRFMVAVGLWDATMASFAYLILFPILALTIHPFFLLGYIIDLPAIAVPVLAKGWSRGEIGKAMISLPCFFALRFVNSVFMLRAVWAELVLGKSLLVYEKGH